MNINMINIQELIDVLVNEKTLRLLAVVFGILIAITIRLITTINKEKSEILKYTFLYSIFIFFISIFITGLISFYKYDYFLNTKKDEKISLLKDTNVFISKFDMHISNTNHSKLEFMNQPIFQKMKDEESETSETNIPDKNNMPGPFGIVLSRSEISELERDTVEITEQIIATYSSFRIHRIIKDLTHILARSPWILEIEILMKPDGGGNFEEKGAKLKETVSKVKKLLSQLYLEMQKEISNRVKISDYIAITSTTDKIIFDLKDLRYGSDISVFQNLEELITKSQKKKLKLSLFPIPPRESKLSDFKQISDTSYEVTNNINLKRGDKFVILAFDKEVCGEGFCAIVKLLETGVYSSIEHGEDDNLVGWHFTPPNAKLQQDNLWCAHWN